AGTDAAMETADDVLMGYQLNRIPYAYSQCKATVRYMKQNMFFAVGTVAILLAGLLLGKVFVSAVMLIDELGVLDVIFTALNLLRLIRFKEPNSQNKDYPVKAIPEMN